jgi:hypothetical protein
VVDDKGRVIVFLGDCQGPKLEMHDGDGGLAYSVLSIPQSEGEPSLEMGVERKTLVLGVNNLAGLKETVGAKTTRKENNGGYLAFYDNEGKDILDLDTNVGNDTGQIYVHDKFGWSLQIGEDGKRKGESLGLGLFDTNGKYHGGLVGR